jgi:hypothetical protein
MRDIKQLHSAHKYTYHSIKFRITQDINLLKYNLSLIRKGFAGRRHLKKSYFRVYVLGM